MNQQVINEAIINKFGIYYSVIMGLWYCRDCEKTWADITPRIALNHRRTHKEKGEKTNAATK